jgi:hypothetical protein
MTAAGREPKIFRAAKLLNARHFAAQIRNLYANMIKSKLNGLCDKLSLFRYYLARYMHNVAKTGRGEARFSFA